MFLLQHIVISAIKLPMKVTEDLSCQNVFYKVINYSKTSIRINFGIHRDVEMLIFDSTFS